MGLSNMFATIPGILSPLLVGLLTPNVSVITYGHFKCLKGYSFTIYTQHYSTLSFVCYRELERNGSSYSTLEQLATFLVESRTYFLEAVKDKNGRLLRMNLQVMNNFRVHRLTKFQIPTLNLSQYRICNS